jgi:hypothetical protein
MKKAFIITVSALVVIGLLWILVLFMRKTNGSKPSYTEHFLVLDSVSGKPIAGARIRIHVPKAGRFAK